MALRTKFEDALSGLDNLIRIAEKVLVSEPLTEEEAKVSHYVVFYKLDTVQIEAQSILTIEDHDKIDKNRRKYRSLSEKILQDRQKVALAPLLVEQSSFTHLKDREHIIDLDNKQDNDISRPPVSSPTTFIIKKLLHNITKKYLDNKEESTENLDKIANYANMIDEIEKIERSVPLSKKDDRLHNNITKKYLDKEESTENLEKIANYANMIDEIEKIERSVPLSKKDDRLHINSEENEMQSYRLKLKP